MVVVDDVIVYVTDFSSLYNILLSLSNFVKMAGRSPAPRSITNAIMTHNQLEMYYCTPRELHGAMNKPMHWLQWLAEHRLIWNSNDCGICQQPMVLVRCAESPDGFSSKYLACNSRASIRTGSCFAHCILGSTWWWLLGPRSEGKACYFVWGYRWLA